jgi:hypothetical protein
MKRVRHQFKTNGSLEGTFVVLASTSDKDQFKPTRFTVKGIQIYANRMGYEIFEFVTKRFSPVEFC